MLDISLYLIYNNLYLIDRERNKMRRTYIAFYKERKITVEAASSYEAQIIAAQLFKSKKCYDVTVVLADVEFNPASL